MCAIDCFRLGNRCVLGIFFFLFCSVFSIMWNYSVAFKFQKGGRIDSLISPQTQVHRVGLCKEDCHIINKCKPVQLDWKKNKSVSEDSMSVVRPHNLNSFQKFHLLCSGHKLSVVYQYLRKRDLIIPSCHLHSMVSVLNQLCKQWCYPAGIYGEKKWTFWRLRKVSMVV